MADKQKLVVVISRGLDDERASVAWSIANAGVASEFEVLAFLVSAGVDWARKGAADVAHLNPMDPPMNEFLHNFIEGGGTIQVCPPCAKVRAYSENDMLDGIVLAGAPAMLEWVKQGAQVVSI